MIGRDRVLAGRKRCEREMAVGRGPRAGASAAGSDAQRGIRDRRSVPVAQYARPLATAGLRRGEPAGCEKGEGKPSYVHLRQVYPEYATTM